MNAPATSTPTKPATPTPKDVAEKRSPSQTPSGNSGPRTSNRPTPSTRTPRNKPAAPRTAPTVALALEDQPVSLQDATKLLRTSKTQLETMRVEVKDLKLEPGDKDFTTNVQRSNLLLEAEAKHERLVDLYAKRYNNGKTLLVKDMKPLFDLLQDYVDLKVGKVEQAVIVLQEDNVAIKSDIAWLKRLEQRSVVYSIIGGLVAFILMWIILGSLHVNIALPVAALTGIGLAIAFILIAPYLTKGRLEEDAKDEPKKIKKQRTKIVPLKPGYQIVPIEETDLKAITVAGESDSH